MADSYSLRSAIHHALIGFAVLLSLAISFPSQAEETASFFQDIPFENALKQAQQDHKIVFIDFYTTWCGPCKRLDATTWQDPTVVALLKEKTVALKLDAEKNPGLAKRYSVNAYPTMALIKPDGTAIDSLVGYQDAKTFTENFNSALAGKTSLVRAREAVEKAQSGNRQDLVEARYHLGQELAHKGQNAEALTEYLWCFDDGMKKSVGYDGVRLSFLLSDIANLGRQYPPALDALKLRRDKALAELSAPSITSSAAQDFSSLNHYLGEDQVTLAYFDKLPAGSSQRAVMGREVFDLLLAAQRYPDAVTARPYALYLTQFNVISAQAGMMPAEEGKDIKEYLMEDAAKELEALAGAGNVDDAHALLKTVLAFDHSPATVKKLREHLQRAGHEDLLPKDV